MELIYFFPALVIVGIIVAHSNRQKGLKHGSPCRESCDENFDGCGPD
ncbi:MAG TPA: hypothetical protein VKE98_11290 [Gemmataceae bacterium]|nr:hypothetical protein [Gemmataceae bacterium]